MFHQPASQRPAFLSPARVLTPADDGWGEERDRSFAPFRADVLVPGQVVAANVDTVVVAAESGHLTRRRLDRYRRPPRENARAASRTDARLRAERERPKKDLRRAINRSSHHKA